MKSFDAIVIGGGINGLAAAGKLALAGARVTVLEAGSQTGGMSITAEFAKGFRASAVAHLSHGIDERLSNALKLQEQGLKWHNNNVASTALSADGDHLLLRGAFGKDISGGISAEDQKAWGELRAVLLKNAALLQPFKTLTPPRLNRDHGSETWPLMKAGFKIRTMGRDALREFMRLILINIADLLEDELNDDRLRGLLAFDTVLGHFAGPRSPNSLLGLYHRISSVIDGQQGALALPQGGMGSITTAVQNALETLKVNIRCKAKVARIVVKDGRATGVELASGEVIAADMILSAIHPKTTLLSLIGAPEFDTGFVQRATNIRSRGGAAKLHLALKDTPDFRGADLKTRLVIAPSVRAVEDSFNAIKYGEYSPEPVMECVIPTAYEPELAPEGHHVLSAIVQYAPHDLRQGWTDGRAGFMEAIIKQLEHYAPGIRKQIVAAELLTPADLAARYGAVGGQWHHAELSVEQMLFLRPAIGLAQYSTPIHGLYLASAAMHPGGGVTGTAGWNAATQALQSVGAK